VPLAGCVSIPPPSSNFNTGTAGASARREHEQRRTSRERLVRERHPHVGGLLLALREAPSHEQVWARGARGEEHVAAELAKRLDDRVVVLHDRRIPGRRANIDHIAIARSGVWVIDTKRYQGRVAIHRPLIGEAKLTIAGRDRTKLVDGLAGQVQLIKAAMSEIGADVPVRGALCFVDTDLPLLGSLSFKGFPLLYPRALAKRINAAGPVWPSRVPKIAGALAHRFPVA